MTAAGPAITVIMATWGRGRHILPSIQSVLAQEFGDFELLVIGDACTDETEAVVRAIGDPRVRWLNLAERVGSQSGPNNAGIAAARGGIIAYLGHDDLWSPGHLSQVLRVFNQMPSPDFVVSGLINHLPNGLSGSSVFGLLPKGASPRNYPLPPSAFAHLRSVTDRIGPWGMPSALRTRVDRDLLERACAAGLQFRTTDSVTVHKFSAADRYLCYLEHSSDEQQAMLDEMAAPGFAARVAALVADAQRHGTYMKQVNIQVDQRAPGEIARNSNKRRGITMPETKPLPRRIALRQHRQDCALDWHAKPVLGIRFHLRNPKPKLLLPFYAFKPVRLTLRIVHPDRNALGPVALRCNGQQVLARPRHITRSLWGWTALFDAELGFQPDKPTVVEFHLTDIQSGKGQGGLGFGIGRMRLQPL